MSVTDIQKSVQSVIEYFTENPDKAHSQDKPATAVLEDGLRCRVDWNGQATIITDMSKALGGGALGPSGGWLSRVAVATCIATTISLRAAQVGIELTTLEVTVESVSDDRGLLGMGNDIPAGMLTVRIRVKIGAEGVENDCLQELVAWGEAHSPVVDTVRRAVPYVVEVETR